MKIMEAKKPMHRISRAVVSLAYVLMLVVCDLHAYADPLTTAPEVESDSEASTTISEETPRSLKRLFGESIPYPEPDDTGLEIYALAMHDFYANTTGGARKGGGVMGNLFVSLTVDTAKAGLWDDGKLVLEGIGVYGRRPSKVVRDYQFTSSIDAPDTVEPYQLFYDHSFLNERISWVTGIHDYSLDFAVIDYGWDFIHSSFWTPSTMTQFWWSFYPTTGLGTRARIRLTETAYLMGGVYDGNPTDQANYRRIDWGLSKKDGLHSLLELGVSEDAEGKRPFKLALGGWYNSGEFNSADGGVMHSNFGTYAVGQALLVSEDDTFERGLGGFFQIGQADSQRNFNSWYFGAGLRYKGLLGSRKDDTVALGWGRAQISPTFRDTNPGTDSFEGNVELTYRALIRPWLTLQPAVQLITNPGAISNRDDAVVLYLRTEVVL